MGGGGGERKSKRRRDERSMPGCLETVFATTCIASRCSGSVSLCGVRSYIRWTGNAYMIMVIVSWVAVHDGRARTCSTPVIGDRHVGWSTTATRQRRVHHAGSANGAVDALRHTVVNILNRSRRQRRSKFASSFTCRETYMSFAQQPSA